MTLRHDVRLAPAVLASLIACLLAAARVQSAATRQTAAPPPSMLSQGAPNAFTLIGQAGGSSACIALDGTAAVVGLGSRIVSLDVSRAQPAVLGQGPPLVGLVRDVAVVDKTAYVAAGAGGLRILAGAAPSGWVRMSQASIGADSRALEVLDGVAYIADGSAGLRLVDVRDPTALLELGLLDTPGSALDVVVDGGRAFVADGESGLRVVDVSAPTAPTVLGSVDTPAEGLAVALGEAYALVADGVAGLQVVDLSDIAKPSIAATLDTPGACLDVALDRDRSRAYVADGAAGVRVVDVATPGAPIDLGATGTGGVARAIAVRGSLVYVTDEDGGVTVLQDDGAGSLAVRGVLDLPGPCNGVQTADPDSAYVVGLTEGLSRWDVTDPRAPIRQWRMTVPGRANSVALRGPSALVAALEGGLQLATVEGAGGPALLGSYEPLGLTEDAAWRGEVALLTDGESLLSVDVSRPEALAELDTLGHLLGASSVEVAGDTAYVGGWQKGIWTVDVARPTTMRRLSTLPLPGGASDIAVAGNTLYVAADVSGLHVVEVADRQSPRLAGSVDTAGHAEAVAMAERTAFVADREGGVLAVDVSDPAVPAVLAIFDTPGQAVGVSVAGDRILVADEAGGLVVLRWGPEPVVGGALYLPMAVTGSAARSR